MICFTVSLPYGQDVPTGKYAHLIKVCDQMLFKKLKLDNGCTQNGYL